MYIFIGNETEVPESNPIYQVLPVCFATFICFSYCLFYPWQKEFTSYEVIHKKAPTRKVYRDRCFFMIILLV